MESAKPSTRAKPGKDLEAFRSAHDKSYIVPRAIERGLKELGDAWLYEQEFCQLCKLSLADFGRFRDRFAEHCVEIGGNKPRRAWAGTKAFAKKLAEAHRGDG